MAIKNVTLTVNFYAYDTAAKTGKTGDAANINMFVVKDGGAAAAATNAETEVDATNMPGVYELVLTAAEMNANLITVGGKSSTADVVVTPISIATDQGKIATLQAAVDALNDLSAAQVNAEVDTALADYDGPTHTELIAEVDSVQSDIAALNDPTAAAIADTVWDEAKSGHVGAGSFGEEVQAHALSTEVSALNNLDAATVKTQADQALVDIGLDHMLSAPVVGADVADNSLAAKLTSKSATADFDDYNHTTDSLQAIADKATAASGGAPIHSGTAQAGTATSITLAAGAPVVPLKGNKLVLVGGTGEDQVREILTYDTVTKVATVAAWDVVPDVTTLYEVRAALSVSLTITGGVAGPGADPSTTTVKDSGSNPIGNAQVWYTTDAAGRNMYAGPLVTDANGKAGPFMIDDGMTAYEWIEIDGYFPQVGVLVTLTKDP